MTSKHEDSGILVAIKNAVSSVQAIEDKTMHFLHKR
jgi:hypothetical protein